MNKTGILLFYTVFIYTGIYMLSTFMQTTSTHSYSLDHYNEHSSVLNPLLHIHYQQNDYHDLLTHIKKDQAASWILFLAPPGKPNAQFLQQAGIDKSRVLMIDSSKVNNNIELLSTLLKSNNYSTIITWTNQLSEITRQQLKEDCASSHTHCFIYCKH